MFQLEEITLDSIMSWMTSLFSWKSWVVWIIRILKWWKGRRLPTYVSDINKPLDITGAIASETAWKLELPKPNYLFQEKSLDEVSMKGFNSKGDCLVVQISRRSINKTDVVIYLKLNGRGRYQLPIVSDAPPESQDAESLCYRGLKIKCLYPMKKWRISFNGFLRNLNADPEEKTDVVQVKFVFLWTSITVVCDFQDHLYANVLTKLLDKESLFELKNLNFLEQYEQWGQFSGTVSIEESPEVELYLWGPRKRNTGEDLSLFTSATKFYCQMKDGTVFHLGSSNLSSLKHELKYGYLIPVCKARQIVEDWFQVNSEKENLQLIFTTGNKRRILNVEEKTDQMIVYLGEKQNIRIEMTQAVFLYNGVKCNGIIERVKIKDRRLNLNSPQQKRFVLCKQPDILDDTPTIVSLDDPICQNSKLTGGKGSSLAALITIARELDQQDEKFLVPKGLVVTTAAYRQSISTHLIKQIQSLQNSINKKKELESECNRVQQEFNNLKLSKILKQILEEKLKSIWNQDLDSVLFAVRSSSVAEDSLETSAAGQMETFLGIRGLNQIYECIAKCWGSQFSYLAISYKVQTGQILDTDMAIVIQEMIPADMAGVVFTCDPITGSPANITIMANYGLGESVVSAATEPDTIILKRSWDNKLAVHSQTIGGKNINIKLSDSNGTRTEETVIEDREKCCLSLDMIEKIGRIAVQVEECFGNSRDIEWCVKHENIYLLQARPITTTHQENEFELIHEFDTGIFMEDEYYTTANVGEVLPGAMTPLSISTISVLLETTIQTLYNNTEGDYSYYHPEFYDMFPISCRHLFFYLTNAILKRTEKGSSLVSKGWVYAILGRELENEDELRKLAVERYGYYPTYAKIKGMLHVPKDLLLTDRRVYKRRKHLEEMFKEMNDISDTNSLYKMLFKKLNLYSKCLTVHLQACMVSMLCNSMVLSILAEINKEINDTLLIQLSNLLSNCQNVESADVPAYLEKFANVIKQSKKRQYFMDKNVQKVLEWVKSDKGEIGQMFQNFISQHGHRCIKEFEFSSKTWEMEPLNLIKLLQTMISGPSQNRKQSSSESSMKTLVDSLDLKTRLILKIFTICAKKGIRLREKTKSLIIKTVDMFRKGYMKLGNMMEKEGRIPDSNLIYFFTHEEIGRLLDKREAHMITKAIRRRRIHSKLDSLLFPEIMIGPCKPFEDYPETEFSSDWTVKGIPVCHGIVTGIARVIRKREDIPSIQSGEILVTYSTDIGWSPYFPLLAGLVTEIGGLISHGAVIAREYGLPCIIAANGVLSIVKTGENVILDANRGVLKKMQ